jgi:hypothetical protein
MKSNQKEGNSNKGLIIVAIAALLFVIGLWLITYFTLKGQNERGTFGDMFGSVNALFSGLAFAGIILTILLQSRELSLQRQELKDTREELKRSATAQERTEIAQNRQAENQKISAKLSALNTLVIYYGDIIQSKENSSFPFKRMQATDKRNQYILRIEEILERKENK